MYVWLAGQLITVEDDAFVMEDADHVMKPRADGNDHLHRFSYRNRFGTTVHIHHPFMDEPPFTDEVTIGQLPLRPGDTILRANGRDVRSGDDLKNALTSVKAGEGARLVIQRGKTKVLTVVTVR